MRRDSLRILRNLIQCEATLRMAQHFEGVYPSPNGKETLEKKVKDLDDMWETFTKLEEMFEK